MKWQTRNKQRLYRRQLRIADFEGLDGLLIKDIAPLLHRTYDEVLNAVHRLEIRQRFPAHGGTATQISKRGYDYMSERRAG